MTREEFWMQIYLKDLGSCKESFHADKALAEFDERFPVKNAQLEEESSEWIDWDGGDCPISGDTTVQVWLRKDEVAPIDEWHTDAADMWTWHHDGDGGDIIKYRVVKD